MRFPASALFVLSFIACTACPSLVGADTTNADLSKSLGAGCHLATPQEKAEMVARGIPESFQVCPKDQQILGIGKDFEQWFARLKSQSPCVRNVCGLACRTRNTGAQVCGPTSRRWNSIGCHPNNNTAIFPTVSHGFAAHIELLRRYCGERGRCTIGRVIEQWTGTVGDRPLYAAFVSRNAGMPVNQVFDPNDIDLMGRIALAMSCFEAGALPYNVAELKQGLIMAGGGARVPVPANVGQLLNESLTGVYPAYPTGSPASHPVSWGYPGQTLVGSRYLPPSPPPSSPLPLVSQPATGQQTQSNISNPGTTAAPVVVAPSALIIAQPSVISGTSTVIVSWVSVGMNSSSPCNVLGFDSSSIAQNNEGSVSIQVPKFQSARWLTFTLQCTSYGGASVQRYASVKVVQ